MIVAKFWGKHKETVYYETKKDGKKHQLTIERWGFSNESTQHAYEVAKQRVNDAILLWEQQQHTKPHSFWQLWKREPKVPYNGADGVPIREEILLDKGEEGVLTRNSYGAHCLNTQHMFIADIDKEGMSFRTEHMTSTLFVVSVLVCFTVLLFSRMGFWASLGGGLVVAVPIAVGAKFLFWHMYVLGKKGLAEIVRERLEEHPGLSFRVYETPNGFRVLETSRPYVAASSDTQSLFEQLQTDKLYALMCSKQQCFRARTSGKPWRMDMRKMPKHAWPVEDVAKLEARKLWVKEYEARFPDFAAARLLYIVGEEKIDSKIAPTLAWHDNLTLNEDKPLA